MSLGFAFVPVAADAAPTVYEELEEDEIIVSAADRLIVVEPDSGRRRLFSRCSSATLNIECGWSNYPCYWVCTSLGHRGDGPVVETLRGLSATKSQWAWASHGLARPVVADGSGLLQLDADGNRFGIPYEPWWEGYTGDVQDVAAERSRNLVLTDSSLRALVRIVFTTIPGEFGGTLLTERKLLSGYLDDGESTQVVGVGPVDFLDHLADSRIDIDRGRRIWLLDRVDRRLYWIHPDTGRRVLHTAPGLGSGPPLSEPHDLATGLPGEILVSNRSEDGWNQIIAIDIASGARAVRIETASEFGRWGAIDLEGSGDLIIHRYRTDRPAPLLLRGDLESGTTSVLSGPAQNGLSSEALPDEPADLIVYRLPEGRAPLLAVAALATLALVKRRVRTRRTYAAAAAPAAGLLLTSRSTAK